MSLRRIGGVFLWIVLAITALKAAAPQSALTPSNVPPLPPPDIPAIDGTWLVAEILGESRAGIRHPRLNTKPTRFDSLIVGYYQGKDLMYMTRAGNGFVPASGGQVIERIQ